MALSACKFLVDQRTAMPGIHLELFKSFFEDTIFAAWHDREGSWQLQITGGPGSGKTTLSKLIVEFLRCQYGSDDCRIAAVFFQDRVVLETQKFVQQVLGNVLRQLSGDDRSSDEDVRTDLFERVKTLPRSFLVLDDLDLCSPPIVHALEHELLALQHCGLKVLTTSRIPLHFSSQVACCDIDYDYEENEGEAILVYWICATCDPPGPSFDWKNAYYICERHWKEGQKCPKNKDHELYEPYDRVNFHMDYIFNQSSTAFETFVLGELRMAHGDLKLPAADGEIHPSTEDVNHDGSSIQEPSVGGSARREDGDNTAGSDPPPFSKLGNELKKVPEHVEELVKGVAFEASSNVSVAKLRTDIYQLSQTMQDLDTLKDRIPDTILATFDAATDRVMNLPSDEKRLGLMAIAIVCAENARFPLSALVKALRGMGVVLNGTATSLEIMRDQVIRATCGLLTPFPAPTVPFDPYTHLFRLYVAEGYNEVLAQMSVEYDQFKQQKAEGLDSSNGEEVQC